MFLSVVTINWNNCEGLEKTIRSVISQNKQLYQFIIIDGGSIDGSVDVIHKYDKYIDYWVSESDKGVYNAMNKSLSHANGEYVIFMNSGDEFADKDVLDKVFGANIRTDFIFGGMIRTDHNQEISRSIPDKSVTLYTLLYRVICHQATFTKLSLFHELGGYDESIKISADWCFLFKSLILNNKTCSVVPVYICKYDITGMSAGSEALSKINDEKFNYFKTHSPYLYDDYMKMHNLLRFSPSNIIRYLKWKLLNKA